MPDWIKILIKSVIKTGLDPVIYINGEYYPVYGIRIAKNHNVVDDGTVIMFGAKSQIDDYEEEYPPQIDLPPVELK